MKKTLLALALSAASLSAFAGPNTHTVDVAVQIAQTAVDEYGLEAIEAALYKHLDKYHHILAETQQDYPDLDLDMQRRFVSIEVVDFGADSGFVFGESAFIQGDFFKPFIVENATIGQDVISIDYPAASYFGADSLVRVLNPLDSGGQAGSDGSTVSVDALLGDSFILSHEWGHEDGINGHPTLEEGEICDIMCPKMGQFEETEDAVYFHREQAENLADVLAASRLDFPRPYYGYIECIDDGYRHEYCSTLDKVKMGNRAQPVTPLATITADTSSVDVPVGVNEVSLTFSLDAPLDVDASVEVFTKGCADGLCDDNQATRITVPAGQTQVEWTVSGIKHQATAKTFTAGIRHGYKLDANSLVTVNLAADPSVTPEPVITPEPNDGNDTVTTPKSGGGGGAAGFIALLGLPLLFLRKKLA